MLHVYISGFVQGIGFRQFIRYKARKLNINGWVKNLPDGRVEAVFDGSRLNLEKMIEICKKGPFLSEVEKVEVDWNYKNTTELFGFNIIK